jgi:DedD protein
MARETIGGKSRLRLAALDSTRQHTNGDPNMAETPDVNVDELRRRARRRLVGAIVLALAAAIFVPMMLETEPRPLGEDIAVKIPPVDDGKFVNRLSGSSAKDSGKATAPKADSVKADPPTQESPRSEPVKVEDARSESAPKADSPPGAGGAGSQEPVPARTEPAKAEKSADTPPPNAIGKRSLADAEQRMLNGSNRAPSLQPPAVVMKAAPSTTPTKTPPAASAPAAMAPTASTSAAVPSKTDAAAEFSVQLAAFADDKGANSLANKLKRGGYPAYTEPLTTSKGTLWRVRVGPFTSRDAATASRDKLKGDGYAGIVASSK